MSDQAIHPNCMKMHWSYGPCCEKKISSIITLSKTNRVGPQISQFGAQIYQAGAKLSRVRAQISQVSAQIRMKGDQHHYPITK